MASTLFKNYTDQKSFQLTIILNNMTLYARTPRPDNLFFT